MFPPFCCKPRGGRSRTSACSLWGPDVMGPDFGIVWIGTRFQQPSSPVPNNLHLYLLDMDCLVLQVQHEIKRRCPTMVATPRLLFKPCVSCWSRRLNISQTPKLHWHSGVQWHAVMSGRRQVDWFPTFGLVSIKNNTTYRTTSATLEVLTCTTQNAAGWHTSSTRRGLSYIVLCMQVMIFW